MDQVPPEILSEATDLKKVELPTAGTLTFDLVQYRFGFMVENEEKVGVAIQFWFLPAPWFKFHLPFRTNFLARFLTDLNEMYNEMVEEKKL